MIIYKKLLGYKQSLSSERDLAVDVMIEKDTVDMFNSSSFSKVKDFTEEIQKYFLMDGDMITENEVFKKVVDITKNVEFEDIRKL